MKKFKKLSAVGLAAVMTAAAIVGCGSGDSKGSGDSTGSADSATKAEESGETKTETASSGEKEQITIFNSKMEIQDQMQEMAEQYTELTGVPVEVYYSSDTVAAHLSTRYASNDPYTISMVDAKDIYSLAAEHAVDLSGEKWVADTTQAIAIDGKTYGFPVCVEARGLIYNADAIKNITGKDFDPSAYATLDDFKALIEELKKGGMETPTAVLNEDWSLGAHYLAEVYEQQEDPDAFVKGLNDGSIKIEDDKVFNSMMDTWEVLRDNMAQSNEREVLSQKLAEGEVAFMFGGNWDWSVINQYEYSENMGIMPVPQNGTDANSKLVGGGSKYFFIDQSDNTSATQVQEAKDFLNWLVYDDAGQEFIVNTCALVPAFSNITLEVTDPLGASVKSYVDAGNMIANYNYLPDDHYAKCGQAFQEYRAGKTDRAAFGAAVDEYWKGATLSEH
jgi:raffinose/stachyose/melibiose transport system substrate-binding protein